MHLVQELNFGTVYALTIVILRNEAMIKAVTVKC